MEFAAHLTTIDDHEPIECGKDAAQHFAFEPGYLNLNHEVRAVYRAYQDRVDARPDAFTRYEYRTHLLDQSRQVLSDYLEVPLDSCVLVPNASTAFDTVARNLSWKPGDVVLCFDTVYGSFEYSLQFLTEMTPLEYVKVPYDVTESEDRVCDAFESRIKELRSEGKTPRLAVFNTVGSSPGARMPFERLTQLCRNHQVLSFIDGAHGIGQLRIDLTALDPDFFTSNLHKWLYVPRPCALMYVPRRHQNSMRATLPTGFDFLPRSATTPMEGKVFAANFQSVGTLDDSAYLCIKAALDWRKRVVWSGKQGEDAVIGYLHDLAAKGGKLVAEVLGTEVIENPQGTLSRSALVNIRLPLPETANTSTDLGAVVMKRVMQEHYTAVSTFSYRGHYWVRLSAQVYLTLDDFEKAAWQLKGLCEKLAKEHRKT